MTALFGADYIDYIQSSYTICCLFCSPTFGASNSKSQSLKLYMSSMYFYYCKNINKMTMNVNKILNINKMRQNTNRMRLNINKIRLNINRIRVNIYSKKITFAPFEQP